MIRSMKSMKSIPFLSSILFIFILAAAFKFYFSNVYSVQADYDAFNEFVEELQSHGYDVDSRDAVRDILAGDRKLLTLDQNVEIAVYLYEDSDAMQHDAQFVDASGFRYEVLLDGQSKYTEISWPYPPHFFKHGSIIVLYVGDDQELIRNLKDILGAPFAGEL